MSYVFDASSVLILTRELGKKVVDLVRENFTTSLAYYEVANSLWKECKLFKRLSVDEAVEVLKFTFSLLSMMNVMRIEEVSSGVNTLSNAAKLNITYYDASYLTIARQLHKVLVTDDEKLATAAKKIGVRTLVSRSFT